jgi:hypothetical protein
MNWADELAELDALDRQAEVEIPMQSDDGVPEGLTALEARQVPSIAEMIAQRDRHQLLELRAWRHQVCAPVELRDNLREQAMLKRKLELIKAEHARLAASATPAPRRATLALPPRAQRSTGTLHRAAILGAVGPMRLD